MLDDEIIHDHDVAERLQAYLDSVQMPNGRYRHTIDIEKLLKDVVGVTKLSTGGRPSGPQSIGTAST